VERVVLNALVNLGGLSANHFATVFREAGSPARCWLRQKATGAPEKLYPEAPGSGSLYLWCNLTHR